MTKITSFFLFIISLTTPFIGHGENPITSDSLLTMLNHAHLMISNNSGKLERILEELPIQIDSIEIKYVTFRDFRKAYFAIDRKAFDQTFEYLREVPYNGIQTNHIKSSDNRFISQFVTYFQTSRPFSSEAMTITPRNAWRQSKGYNTNSHGIIQSKAENVDPIEVRGKMSFFSNGKMINCFFSQFTIDYGNHRYEMPPELHYFLFFYNIGAM